MIPSAHVWFGNIIEKVKTEKAREIIRNYAKEILHTQVS